MAAQPKRSGRRWVLANVHDGVLDEAAVQLGLEVDPAAHSADIVSARGSMRYHDLTINYFNGLAAGSQGQRHRHARRQAARVHAHRQDPSNGSKSPAARCDITDLGAPVEWQTIDLALAGPIRDVLEVIDVKPLRYAHDIGVDPAHVAGRTEFQPPFQVSAAPYSEIRGYRVWRQGEDYRRRHSQGRRWTAT